MTLFDGGNTTFEISTFERAAEGVVASILPENLEATKNQFVYVHSATMTSNQIFDSLKKNTHTTDKDWSVDNVDTKKLTEESLKSFREVVTNGDPPQVFSKTDKFNSALMEMITAGYVGDGFNQFGEQSKQWNRKFGLKEQDLDTVVKQIVEEFEAEKQV